MNVNPTPHLKVGTGWIRIWVKSEPDVRMTIKGYQPILHIVAAQTGLEYVLFIGAKSLAEKLEALRATNAGKFAGLEFELKKEDASNYAKYELRSCGADQS